MSHNTELVHLMIDRGFNQGDLSVADEICAEQFTLHGLFEGDQQNGPEALKQHIASLRKRVAELELTVEDITATGNKVWLQVVTHGREVQSGKPITIREIDICRFENGLMIEYWEIPDRFPLLGNSDARNRLQA
jgi:ketosteroid isomerase-like protein